METKTPAGARGQHERSTNSDRWESDVSMSRKPGAPLTAAPEIWWHQLWVGVVFSILVMFSIGIVVTASLGDTEGQTERYIGMLGRWGVGILGRRFLRFLARRKQA